MINMYLLHISHFCSPISGADFAAFSVSTINWSVIIVMSTGINKTASVATDFLG